MRRGEAPERRAARRTSGCAPRLPFSPSSCRTPSPPPTGSVLCAAWPSNLSPCRGRDRRGRIGSPGQVMHVAQTPALPVPARHAGHCQWAPSAGHVPVSLEVLSLMGAGFWCSFLKTGKEIHSENPTSTRQPASRDAQFLADQRLLGAAGGFSLWGGLSYLFFHVLFPHLKISNISRQISRPNNEAALKRKCILRLGSGDQDVRKKAPSARSHLFGDRFGECLPEVSASPSQLFSSLEMHTDHPRMSLLWGLHQQHAPSDLGAAGPQGKL